MGMDPAMAEFQRMKQRADRCASAEKERDELKAELAEQTYRGNSVAHWWAKAKAYGDIVHACEPALEAAGVPVGVGLPRETIAAAVKELATERDQLRIEVERLRGTEGRVLERNERQRLMLRDRDAQLAAVTEERDGAKEWAAEMERERDDLRAKEEWLMEQCNSYNALLSARHAKLAEARRLVAKLSLSAAACGDRGERKFWLDSMADLARALEGGE